VWSIHPIFNSIIHLSPNRWFTIKSLVDIIIFIVSLIIFFGCLLMASSKHSIYRWIFYSAGAALIRYGTSIFLKTLPSLFYRYSGVFDLIMIFGWLMIINTSIKKEYSFGISQN